MKDFTTKDELFAYLRENKDLLKIEKKNAIKYADGVGMFFVRSNDKGEITTTKSLDADIAEEAKSKLRFNAKVVINTTNLMDSHMDVHIPGLWKKSIKENKNIYLLQEHQHNFKGVISDEVKATTSTMSWSELGEKYEGTTEALIFDADIDKQRNEYMAEQYINGRVKNHSVGMRYVNLFFCMNSDSKWDVEEKSNWDKYISFVANKETAEMYGYFWAVTEAKIIEGSAVLFGSNPITPTISVKTEPEQSTQENEPPDGTHKEYDITADEIKAIINKSLN